MYTYALVTLFMLRRELCLQGIRILKEKHMFSNLDNSLCVMMYQEMTFIHWTSVCTSWFCAISQSSSLSSLLDGGSREFPNAKPLVVDPKVTSGIWGGAWGDVIGLVVTAVAVGLYGGTLFSKPPVTLQSLRPFPNTPSHPPILLLFSSLAQGLVCLLSFSTSVSYGFCVGFSSSYGGIELWFTAFALSPIWPWGKHSIFYF